MYLSSIRGRLQFLSEDQRARELIFDAKIASRLQIDADRNGRARPRSEPDFISVKIVDGQSRSDGQSDRDNRERDS